MVKTLLELEVRDPVPNDSVSEAERLPESELGKVVE